MSRTEHTSASHDQEQTHAWVANNNLTPSDVDCATTVMLKILDGKCKMKPQEKQVMSYLYEATKQLQGNLLGQEIHSLIATSKGQLSEQSRDHIYEKRVLAETMISRPVMKKFKAMIRQQGLFQCVQPEVQLD